jgi:hypothetical protein
MKSIIIPMVAALGGLLLGIMVSEVIGIVGFMATGETMGIRYLPIFLAGLAAMIAIVVQLRRAKL